MSMAHECDRCGELYRPTKGSAIVDINVADKTGETFTGWSDVDLCAKCARLVIDVLGAALNDPPE